MSMSSMLLIAASGTIITTALAQDSSSNCFTNETLDAYLSDLETTVHSDVYQHYEYKMFPTIDGKALCPIYYEVYENEGVYAAQIDDYTDENGEKCSDSSVFLNFCGDIFNIPNFLLAFAPDATFCSDRKFERIMESAANIEFTGYTQDNKKISVLIGYIFDMKRFCELTEKGCHDDLYLDTDDVLQAQSVADEHEIHAQKLSHANRFNPDRLFQHRKSFGLPKEPMCFEMNDPTEAGAFHKVLDKFTSKFLATTSGDYSYKSAAFVNGSYNCPFYHQVTNDIQSASEELTSLADGSHCAISYDGVSDQAFGGPLDNFLDFLREVSDFNLPHNMLPILPTPIVHLAPHLMCLTPGFTAGGLELRVSVTPSADTPEYVQFHIYELRDLGDEPEDENERGVDLDLFTERGLDTSNIIDYESQDNHHHHRRL